MMRKFLRLSYVLQWVMLAVPASKMPFQHKCEHHCAVRDTAFQMSCKPNPHIIKTALVPPVRIQSCPYFSGDGRFQNRDIKGILPTFTADMLFWLLPHPPCVFCNLRLYSVTNLFHDRIAIVQCHDKTPLYNLKKSFWKDFFFTS